MGNRKRIIFINSHPIQYFAPLYKYLNEHDLPTACWYCSDENLKGHFDKQFSSRVAWDIPVLEGYTAIFFRNYSWKPSLYNGFFGLINPGIIRALWKEPRGIVIVHGWAYLSHVLAIVFGRIFGHRVCLRGESPLNQELLRSKANRTFKKIILQGFLFRFVNRFLYIGSQNKNFYSHYGVKQSRMSFAPYAVDNDRFRRAAEMLLPNKSHTRQALGLPAESKIILFAAKFIDKKRPMDLLIAYEKLQVSGKCLVMVGEGQLRGEMENFIRDRSLDNVFLTGFVNQTEIEKYYSAADVFVMCSGKGETWGLSVNEAMNFSLPVIVSDITGCSDDLVTDMVNGIRFETGNVEALRECIEKALTLHVSNTDLLDRYSYESIGRSLSQLTQES